MGCWLLSLKDSNCGKAGLVQDNLIFIFISPFSASGTKAAKDTFQIHYGNYNSDFVIETKSAKYIAEPKAENEIQDETVLAKARAAALWCKHATAHVQTNGGKPWRYLLISDWAIPESKTLQGLAAAHTIACP